MTTLGYVWADSPFHRMRAATKLGLFLAAVVCVVLASGPVALCAVTLLTLVAVRVSRVPARRVLSLVWGMRWFLLMILAFNALLFSEKDPIWSFWVLHLTPEGMAQGARVVLRTVLVVALGSLLTCTTKPQEMVQGVRDVLRPLARLGLNTELAALCVGVTVQFVPILLQETQALLKAQSVRLGISGSGNITERITNFVRLLVPIFVSAFRRADELSLAMEARGYTLGTGTAASHREKDSE